MLYRGGQLIDAIDLGTMVYVPAFDSYGKVAQFFFDGAGKVINYVVAFEDAEGFASCSPNGVMRVRE